MDHKIVNRSLIEFPYYIVLLKPAIKVGLYILCHLVSILYSSSQTFFILSFSGNITTVSILYSSSQTLRRNGAMYFTRRFPYYIVLLKPDGRKYYYVLGRVPEPAFPYYIVLLKLIIFSNFWQKYTPFPYYIVLLKRTRETK